MNKKFLLALAIAFISITSAKAEEKKAQTIEQRLAQLMPYDLTDSKIASLSANDRKVLFHLIKAADVMNQVYLEQMHPRGRGWYSQLQTLAKKDPSKIPYLKYYKVIGVPFDPFAGDWYLPSEIARETWEPLDGGNLYNVFTNKEGRLVGTTEGELNASLKFYSEAERKEILSPFTVVRGFSGVRGIPYSEMYADLLAEASKHLQAAAAITTDPKLKALCLAKIRAFQTNDFDNTEIAWINSFDSPIQLVIGPMEEEDGVLGTKRAFQAQVALNDIATTKQVQIYLQFLDKFQQNLPHYDQYSDDIAKTTHFTAVNQIYLAGGALNGPSGAIAMAENLPNTREVRQRDGNRQLFFLNSMKGKCENILLPISKIVMNEEQQKYVTCDSNTKFSIQHEIAHGLGPSFYRDAQGGKHEINDVLGKWAGPVEESKADAAGILDRQYMITNGNEKGADAEMQMYATYTADFFRAVRFGATSPHKRGKLFQFNKLREAGAISFDSDGRVRFNREKMRESIRDIVDALISFQLDGNPKKVEAALDPKSYGGMPAEMRALLDKIRASNLPRDLYPQFPGAEQILAGANIPSASTAPASPQVVPSTVR